MAKTKTTRKYLKESFTIINSGNGNLQNLLTFIQPRYYCTRAEGWACDVYVIGDYAITERRTKTTLEKLIHQMIEEVEKL